MEFIIRRLGVKRLILDMIYPLTCPVCCDILPKGKLICDKCDRKLEYIIEPMCKKCGKQLDNTEKEYCYDCNRKKHIYDRGVATFKYNDAIKHSIYRFKYINKREYGAFYASRTVKVNGHIINGWDADVIIPVPLYRKKQNKRGFNQAYVLAKEIGLIMNIPCEKGLLIRKRDTIPQKELNDTERKKNLEGAFAVDRVNLSGIKAVILVDDVYTTGSTVNQCAMLLKAAGVRKVYFIALSIGNGV